MTTTFQKNDIPVFNTFRKMFTKTPKVVTGQKGIYHYIWCCDTIGGETTSLKYDVYVKVVANGVFNGLVEIAANPEVEITAPAHTEVIALIKNNIPKYINPQLISWELVDQTK